MRARGADFTGCPLNEKARSGERSRIIFTIDTGDPKTYGAWTDGMPVECCLHHVMEHLFDLELASYLQVGSRSASLSKYFAVVVGKEADRFRPTCINAQNVHMINLVICSSGHRIIADD